MKRVVVLRMDHRRASAGVLLVCLTGVAAFTVAFVWNPSGEQWQLRALDGFVFAVAPVVVGFSIWMGVSMLVNRFALIVVEGASIGFVYPLGFGWVGRSASLSVEASSAVELLRTDEPGSTSTYTVSVGSREISANLGDYFVEDDPIASFDRRVAGLLSAGPRSADFTEPGAEVGRQSRRHRPRS